MKRSGNMSESNPFDNPSLDPRRAERVVSIHYYGRSGSIFLQSLLDGHPDVLTFPANYLGGFYSFWNEYGDRSPLHIVKAFLHHYEVLFDPTSAEEVFDVGPYAGQEYDFDKMGPNHDEALGVDRERFRDILLAKCLIEVKDFENGRLERKFFLQALHVAYAEALGRDLTGRQPLIVFQAHTPHIDVIEMLFADFVPKIRFLHSVRDPINTMASWFNEMMRFLDDPPLVLPRRTLGRSIDHAKPILSQHLNKDIIDQRLETDPDTQRAIEWVAENSRAVRLEDLHTKPRETLEKICAWLELDWHDCLLESTFDGKLWHWSTGGRTVSGFQTATIKQQHSDAVSWYDRLRLRFFFADKYDAWDYPLAPWYRWAVLRVLSFGLWFLPFRFEISLWRRRKPKTLDDWRQVFLYYRDMRQNIFSRWWSEFRKPIALIKRL